MLQLTAAQVQALAPDAAAATAGKKLGKPGPWRNLGYDADALWGECQGSALYHTQVARLDLASKCSCPSRKFPCKHALGLLFLAADSPGGFAESAAPEWVTSWLGKRTATQEKKQAAADKPVDEGARDKRAQKRQLNIGAGLDLLDSWMSDLVRQGLARLQSESPSFWDTQARRLVDAQAPGLASRVRNLSACIGRGTDWPARMLDELGVLALITHAYRRQGELTPLMQADLKRVVGVSLEQSEVVAHGDHVEDTWTVVAEHIERDDRVRAQRSWLVGEASGRTALLLQFAATGATFSEALALGTRLRAKLAFWPSAAPQRALVVERLSQPAATVKPPKAGGVLAARARFAETLGKLPWLERELFVLDHVVPQPGEPAQLVDREGHAVALASTLSPLLLALSGGHPIAIAGEWDGYALVPLSAWTESDVVSLAPRAE